MKKSSKNFYWLVLAGWFVSFVVAGVSIYMKGINEKTAVVAIAAISYDIYPLYGKKHFHKSI